MKRSEDLVILNQAMRMSIHSGVEDFKGTKLDLDKLKDRIKANRKRCPCSRASNMECASKQE